MANSTEFHLPFLKKEIKAENTFSFFFDRKGSGFTFLPGQYIRMTLQHETPDNRGTGRFFTVYSSPSDLDYITITTKVIQSTFKKTLADLKGGEVIKFFGPMGNFILDESDTTPRVLLAGGIGITPYHSMLRYAAAKNLSIPLTLLVSFSTKQEMVFYDELMEVAKAHNSIKVIYTITKPEQSMGEWSGETGRISADLLRKYVANIVDQKYYLVGPTVMVEAMHKMLQDELKLPEEKIISENFPGY